MTPERYCEDKAAPVGSNLYYSLQLVPPQQRQAVLAVHALSQELREVGRMSSDPSVARAKLSWWRDELLAAGKGDPRHPVSRALAQTLHRYRLGAQHLRELVDATQLDLDYNRYPDFATLEAYCNHASGSLWTLTAQILGHSQPDTLESARLLGIGLRLAEIIADAGTDARRNRIYMPLDELQRFGLTSDDVIARHDDERFERLMALQIDRARAQLERAISILPQPDRKAQRAGLAMAALERALLQEIARTRGHTLNQRIALTPLRKLWIARRTWLTA